MIPADQEISIGTVTEFTGGGMTLIPGVVGRIEKCESIFTFTPRAGETYRVSEALRSAQCEYTVRDSADAIVPVVKRIPTGGAPSAWCEELPAP